ncbi:MAG: hypothetical protein JW788_01455 [Candidatus Omnitrophica bacterium]|nr:hypothetical protein [Candidatus Omnitrophota bacterium]
MDEIVFGNIMTIAAITGCVLSFLVALDLLTGARVLSFVKKILDRRFNADKIIINLGHAIRVFLDKMVNFDEHIVNNPKKRLKWGTIFLVIGIFIVVLLILGR